LRTAEYADIDPAERGEFLRRQLRVVGAWSRIASLISTQPISSDDAMRGFIAQLDRWLQATSGEERDQMATAVKDGTVCWLSTTDISGQPLAMRRELAERLAHELNRGAEVSPAGLVDAEDRELLLVNAQSLVEAYAYKLAAEYAALPADERPQFIDEQLAAVQRWGVIELLSPAPSDATAASKNQTAAMLALVEQSRAWVDNAPEADRPQVAAFVRGLEQRLLWKQLPSWLRRGE
jgi:hypothetical protein